MKFFIGCSEICGLVNIYANALRKAGHSVTTYVESKNRYYPNEKYDIVASYWADYLLKKSTDHPIAANPDLFNKIAFSLKIRTPLFDSVIEKRILDAHDVFIFIYAGIYTTRNGKDLRILREKNKKIISVLVGTDVRYAYAFGKEFNVDVSKWPKRFLESYDHYSKVIRDVEEYSDVILSVPDQMGLAIRPYSHFQIPLQLEKYKFKYCDRDIPVVIHAPSEPAAKGTDIVLGTLEQLKNEGINFEIKFIQNMSHSELMQLLTDADILVDELYAHGPGFLSFEAMASGCAVATRFYENSPDCFRAPVVNITKDTIYQQLKKFLTDKDYRKQLIFFGKEYVEKNNRAEKVMNDILLLMNGTKPNCDYVPQYFKESFNLPAWEESSNEQKKHTEKIARDWMPDYQQYRSSLIERGLI